jgi:hypothetical protein
VAKLDSMQRAVDELGKLQAQTADEIDALLPAIVDHAFRSEV